MTEQAKAGPSVIHLQGTGPGVLDKSQRSRLLRHPNSTLSFAAFDPYLASSRDPSDLSKLSLDDDHCRPRRIVIETLPGHGSFWRWVPSARKQEGVDDEGIFPRLIDICGQPCFCSQDQWDIYKLDPLYDCYVKFPPALTVVVPKGSVPFSAPPPTEGNRKYDDIVEEEYDSEGMIIDDDNPTPIPRPKTSYRKRKPSPREPMHFNFDNAPPQVNSDETNQKRRAYVSFQSLRFQDEEENGYFEEDWQNRNTKLYEPRNIKRARTASPNSGKRAANVHRSKHETIKRARMKEEMEARREIRDRNLMREVLLEVPPCSAQFNDAFDAQNGSVDDDQQGDKHEDFIAESRRRMSELNADRAKERLREKHLGLPDDTRPKRGNQPRRNHEATDKRRVADKDKEAEAAAEETRRREEKERGRAELLRKLARERTHRHEQWNKGPWTLARAIERYKLTCAFFDTANFSAESLPLAFIDIPWPTLRHPLLNRPEDIDWESTSEFFQSVQPSLRGQAYKSFLKVSLQRFHPDRWSGRNLFAAILDEDERNEIETAMNTVSKALGALYAEARLV